LKPRRFKWLALKMAQTEIELGVRGPTVEETRAAQHRLDQMKGKTLTKLPEIYARDAIRIGELGIVANPFDTFVEIGLEIKKKSPLKHTFTIELANDYNGYLPTPEHHDLGGYETWRAQSSYLEVNASRTITSAWVELLKEVAK
jgi:hypothetical protein